AAIRREKKTLHAPLRHQGGAEFLARGCFPESEGRRLSLSSRDGGGGRKFTVRRKSLKHSGDPSHFLARRRLPEIRRVGRTGHGGAVRGNGQPVGHQLPKFLGPPRQLAAALTVPLTNLDEVRPIRLIRGGREEGLAVRRNGAGDAGERALVETFLADRH